MKINTQNILYNASCDSRLKQIQSLVNARDIKSLRRFFLTSSAASVALIAFVLYVAYPVRQK